MIRKVMLGEGCEPYLAMGIARLRSLAGYMTDQVFTQRLLFDEAEVIIKQVNADDQMVIVIPKPKTGIWFQDKFTGPAGTIIMGQYDDPNAAGYVSRKPDIGTGQYAVFTPSYDWFIQHGNWWNGGDDQWQFQIYSPMAYRLPVAPPEQVLLDGLGNVVLPPVGPMSFQMILVPKDVPQNENFYLEIEVNAAAWKDKWYQGTQLWWDQYIGIRSEPFPPPDRPSGSWRTAMIYQYVSINYGDGYPTGISTYLLDAKDPFPSYEWDYNYASLPKYWDQNNSTFYTDGQADFATSPDGIYVFRYEVRKNRITMKINKKPVIGKRYGKLLEGVLFEDEYALPWKSRPLFGFASYQTFEYGLSRIEMGPLQ